jgi:hypothetical protein
MGRVSTEDHVAIADHLGRYCWHVDHGERREWLALWAEDGVFAGATPEPLVGHAQLGGIAEMVWDGAGGRRMRHAVNNLHCDYLDGKDLVRARLYNEITSWVEGGRLVELVVCEMTLARQGDGWLIRRNQFTRLY